MKVIQYKQCGGEDLYRKDDFLVCRYCGRLFFCISGARELVTLRNNIYERFCAKQNESIQTTILAKLTYLILRKTFYPITTI